ncbi:MAG TPA: hypothetical protein VGA63_14540, partial [Geopsychrobacteraceae bacterium]
TWYVAQARLQIDAEIAEKGRFRTETNCGTRQAAVSPAPLRTGFVTATLGTAHVMTMLSIIEQQTICKAGQGTGFLPCLFDGVAKIPPYGVKAFFQDLDILMYAFAPEKSPGLVGQNFCLAIR